MPAHSKLGKGNPGPFSNPRPSPLERQRAAKKKNQKDRERGRGRESEREKHRGRERERERQRERERTRERRASERRRERRRGQPLDHPSKNPDGALEKSPQSILQGGRKLGHGLIAQTVGTLALLVYHICWFVLTMLIMIAIRFISDQPASVQPMQWPSTQLLGAPTTPASHARWPST